MAGMKKRLLKKKRGLRKRVSKPKVSNSVKTYVKRTMSAAIENKQRSIQASIDFGSVFNNNLLNVRPVCPYPTIMPITQGVTQNTRIGNTIKTKKCMLSYVIKPNDYDLATNTIPQPVEIQLFLANTKDSPGTTPVLADFQSLFQLNNSSTQATSTLADLVAPINKDVWNIQKTWRHKIGFASNNGTGNSQNAAYFSNNDFKLNVVRKMDITKYLPKTFKFNDNSSVIYNKGCFFFFQAISCVDYVLAASQTPVHIDYWVDYVFEDA